MILYTHRSKSIIGSSQLLCPWQLSVLLWRDTRHLHSGEFPKENPLKKRVDIKHRWAEDTATMRRPFSTGSSTLLPTPSVAQQSAHFDSRTSALRLTVRIIIIIIVKFVFVIIIIITRPKPAYGRQGLAGSWGQDTNQARIFWGVLNVSPRASGAQLGYKLT